MNTSHLAKQTIRLIRSRSVQLWQDERGLIQASQMILLVLILGVGMIAGAVSLRDQIVQEYGDAALALENLNQSYSYEIIVINDPLDPTDDVIVSSTSYTDTVGSLSDLEDFENNVIVPGVTPDHGLIDPNLLDPNGSAPGGINFPAATPEGINLVQPPPGPNEIAADGEAGGLP